MSSGCSAYNAVEEGMKKAADQRESSRAELKTQFRYMNKNRINGK